MRCWLSTALFALVLGGCADAVGVPDDGFVISSMESGLEITNRSDAHLFYQGIDSETLSLWAGPTAVVMCSDPNCPHVAPGETVVLPWDDVLGWSDDSTKVTVYWWRVVADGQGGWSSADGILHSREVMVP